MVNKIERIEYPALYLKGDLLLSFKLLICNKLT